MTTPNFEQTKSDLAKRVRHVVDEAPATLSNVNRKLVRFAREQPLATTAIALASGFFLARTLARR